MKASLIGARLQTDAREKNNVFQNQRDTHLPGSTILRNTGLDPRAVNPKYLYSLLFVNVTSLGDVCVEGKTMVE